MVDVACALGAEVAVDTLAWMRCQRYHGGFSDRALSTSSSNAMLLDVLTAVSVISVLRWLSALSDLKLGFRDDLVHGKGASAKELAGVAMAMERLALPPRRQMATSTIPKNVVGLIVV